MTLRRARGGVRRLARGRMLDRHDDGVVEFIAQQHATASRKKRFVRRSRTCSFCERVAVLPRSAACYSCWLRLGRPGRELAASLAFERFVRLRGGEEGAWW